MIEWEKITNLFRIVQELVENDDWVEVPIKLDELHERMMIFFENGLADLTGEQKLVVKKEGQEILESMQVISECCLRKKSNYIQEANKISKGKKMIAAYNKV